MNLQLVISAGVLGLLANYFLWGVWVGICFPIFMAMVLLATLYQANASGKRIVAPQAALAALSFVFAFFVAVRGAAGLTFANFCISIYFWILMSHSMASHRLMGQFTLEDYFQYPWDFGLRSMKTGAAHLVEHSSQITGCSIAGDKEMEIRRGILVAIPILIVFLILMVLADDSFQAFVSRINQKIVHLLQNIEIFTLLGRSGFVVIVTAFLTGVFLLFRKAREVSATSTKPKEPGFSFISGMVVMTLVNGLFFVFSLFQTKFLLGYAQGYLSEITNRENFYMMMVLGILAFIGLCILESNLQRQTESQRRFYHLNVILAVCFSLIVMASAYYRFMLYEQAWGFTIRRFYAHSFVPYFAFFYLMLTAKIFLRWPRTVFLNGMMGLTTGLFLFWNLWNPHAFVAKKNMEMREGVVPPVYLESLSYDAVPVFVERLETQGRLEGAVHCFLANQNSILIRNADTSWQSAHWAKHQARQALQRYRTRADAAIGQFGISQISNITSWPGFIFCIALGIGIVVLVGSVVV